MLLAGGTDIFPAYVQKNLPKPVLDVSQIEEMRGIVRGESGWRIGGATTWTEIARAELPPAFAGLQQAARQIGARQVQNRGTIAGNLCNASPAADGVPPLLTLDAQVELSSQAGQRRLPLADFITGYRRTARREDEILTAIHVPQQAAQGTASFVKLGARSHLVISIVMVAVRLERAEDGAITTARIAVGAAADRARRLTALEADVIGKAVENASAAISPQHLSPLAPIDDVRATAAYRRDAAITLLRDALNRAERG
jgi:CO/xanthine dehydrogenase FAD-binding subunit